MNFPGNHSLSLDLYAAFCETHAIKSARDYHTVSFDLALDLCVLTKDHGLLGNNISFDVPVDSERSGQRQRPFQRHSLIDESCPLFAPAVARTTRPLPRHKNSP